MMKKILFVTVGILLMASSAFSQRSEAVSIDKFRAASEKDTAYVRFQSEVRALAKKAHGRTALTSQAKRLFARNASLLNRVNTQFDRTNLLNRSTPEKAIGYKIDPSMSRWSGTLTAKLSKSLAPYGAWNYVELANANTLQMDAVNLATGEVSYHVVEPGNSWSPSFKNAHTGFVASIMVPDNPKIIAARLKVEYSFFYTGWDTYGSDNGIELVLGPNDKFRSPALDSAPHSFSAAPGYSQCDCKFATMDVLLPLDSITTDIKEVHANKTGGFTVDGYVKPNEQVNFHIAVGYMKGSVYGINGQYLYGEFKLKSAKITWLTTAL